MFIYFSLYVLGIRYLGRRYMSNLIKKLTQKNKTLLIFFVSCVVLYIHELYRLFIGCPRVLSECYVDGADRFSLASFVAQFFIFICFVIFTFRLFKKLYYYLKPKLITLGPCYGSIPFKKKNNNKK